MSENSVKTQSKLGASAAGASVFSNTSGVGWVGDAKALPGNRVILSNPRRLAFGLGVADKIPGSPDLWGLISVVVTQEMVGKIVAIPVVIECKEFDNVKPHQEKWLLMLQKAGARCGVARSFDDAYRIATGEKIYDPKTDNKSPSANRSRRAGSS
ncbi:MAG TPA: hypothetical protein EYN91_25475 [Candidatus Melainabacteria bacterium]|jgi:hypothetical protein|nr:hypothetical protein [Candidatus Melainabacteria bacterium]HIN64722.1 hypothetical protein [Candidatus Obscuribacterales bacterium]